MSKWYWKDGRLAVDFTWHDTDFPRWKEAMDKMEKRLGDYEYKVVKKTHCKNGYEVSTVWMGLDHNWMGGQPMIFETMVFSKDGGGYMERYSTESEARAGHKRIVNSWKNKKYKENNED